MKSLRQHIIERLTTNKDSIINAHAQMLNDEYDLNNGELQKLSSPIIKCIQYLKQSKYSKDIKIYRMRFDHCVFLLYKDKFLIQLSNNYDNVLQVYLVLLQNDVKVYRLIYLTNIYLKDFKNKIDVLLLSLLTLLSRTDLTNNNIIEYILDYTLLKLPLQNSKEDRKKLISQLSVSNDIYKVFHLILKEKYYQIF